MTNAEILKHWHKSVWQDGNIAAVADLMAEDPTVQILMPDDRLNPVDVETFAEVFLAQMTAPHGEFLLTIEDGDWVSSLVRTTATANTTGQEFSVSATLFARFSNGKIAEIYSHFDQFKLFEALGALPEDTMSMCLMGETLR